MKALNTYILEKLVITKKTIEQPKSFMTGERVLVIKKALTKEYGLFWWGIITDVEGDKIRLTSDNKDITKLHFEVINDPDKEYFAISSANNWFLYHADIAINELKQYTQNRKNTIFGYRSFLSATQAQDIIDFLEDKSSLNEKLIINKDSINKPIEDELVVLVKEYIKNSLSDIDDKKYSIKLNKNGNDIHIIVKFDKDTTINGKSIIYILKYAYNYFSRHLCVYLEENYDSNMRFYHSTNAIEAKIEIINSIL